jgi:uncharacterized membrane protein
MTQRTPCERVVQTALYEAGGLALATPLFALAFGTGVGHSFLVLAALAGAVILIGPLHDSFFDRIEWHLTARSASRRPHRLRLLHAVTHELAGLAISLPLLMVLADLTFWEAALAELGLTALYVAYAYAFFYAYDLIRPVRPVRPSPAVSFRDGRW